MNDLFLQDYNSFIENLRKKIFETTDLNEALMLAELYGNIRWRNHDGVYYDDELEDFLFKRVLEVINFKELKNFSSKNIFATIIASELYNYGGHTKVVTKWLELMYNDFQHQLVVVRDIHSYIKQKISSYKNTYIYKCKLYGIERIKEILKVSKGSKLIILHTHPDDIVASISARILSQVFNSKTIFYNHADHVFSYGISFADIVCEISKYGIEISHRTGRVKGKQYWTGIPLFSKEKVNLETLRKKFLSLKERKKKEKIIVSCGSAWKYAPNKNISFDYFIDAFLQRRKDVKFIIVGPTGKERWWYKAKTKWKSYVRFTGPIPYEKYEYLLKKADVYVDSFPVTGGTAFPEALLFGIPSVGLKLPFKGYNCADSLRVENIEALIRRIEEIINGERKVFRLMEKTINNLVKFDSEEAFRQRIINLYSLKTINLKTPSCWKSKEEIDTFYLEREWQRRQKILIFSVRLLSKFPFYKRVEILKDLLKITKYIENIDLIKVLLVTVVGKKYTLFKGLKRII